MIGWLGMNRKGQALVEFIIILPVIIYIIMFIVDFMVIFQTKNRLEHEMNEVVTLYKDNRLNDINDLTNNFKYRIDNKYVYLTISEEYKTITPGLNLVLGNPYQIINERVIINE